MTPKNSCKKQTQKVPKNRDFVKNSKKREKPEKMAKNM